MEYDLDATYKIIKPSAPLLQQPINTSSILTECLFGETIQVSESFGQFNYIKLLTDGYEGWIHSNCLGKLSTPSHRVIAIRTFINKKPNLKSNLIHYLSMGSLVKVIKTFDNWCEIELSKKHDFSKGYVPLHHLVETNHKVKDWTSIAEKFLNTPYRWGGRDTLGIDCSALLQLSAQTYGILIPRDTSLQMQSHVFQNVDKKDKNRGSIVFWRGHVAIFIDKTNIIHSNAFTMTTNIEPFKKAEERIKKRYGDILKFVKFN